MRSNTLAGRVGFALGVFATAVLAEEQSTVQVCMAYGETPEDSFTNDDVDVELVSTTDDAVVVMLANSSTEGMDEEEKSVLLGLRPTVTVGQHTFRHSQSVSTMMVETNTIGGTVELYTMTMDFDQLFDCTFVGCPLPTTGSCTSEISVSGTLDDSGSYTVASEDLVFHALSLPTALPEPLGDECDAGSEGGEDAEGDKEDAAGSVAMSWLALVPGLALGLAL